MIPRIDLEEIDRTCCALDDARPRAVVNASAWGEGFPVCRVAQLEAREAHNLEVAGATPVPAPVVPHTAMGPDWPGAKKWAPHEERPLVTGSCVGEILDTRGGVVSSAASPRPTSLATPSIGPTRVIDCAERVNEPSPDRRSGLAVASLCPWCAMERALQRHGPAPRANNTVRVESCERHRAAESFNQSPARRVDGPQPSDSCVSAPGVSPNPNAGIVPAYPKGRW